MCGMVEKVQLAAILQALYLCAAAFRLVCRFFCFYLASYTKIIKLFFFFLPITQNHLWRVAQKWQCLYGIFG